MSDIRTSTAISGRTRQQILDAVTDAGSITRAEIIERTGLSRATITAGIGILLEDGTLLERRTLGARESRRGRRPTHLVMRPPRGILCAIDLGHGHTCVAVGTGDGEILERRWAELDVDAHPDDALEDALTIAAELIATHAGDDGLVAVGVVVPQPVDADSGVVAPTAFLTNWHGLDVASRVTAALGAPVMLENDANAGAIAEIGPTTSGLVFVKVSTGVGAGVVAGRSLVRGPTGQAGELGHVVVRPDGQLCGCGNRGCLETLASMPSIMRALEPIHGRLDRAGLAALLAAGDVASERAMRDAGEAIGTALAPVVAALQIEQVAIGGLDGIPLDALVEGTHAKIRALVHRAIAPGLRIAPSAHAALAPLHGALRLAAQTGLARANAASRGGGSA